MISCCLKICRTFLQDLDITSCQRNADTVDGRFLRWGFSVLVHRLKHKPLSDNHTIIDYDEITLKNWKCVAPETNRAPIQYVVLPV